MFSGNEKFSQKSLYIQMHVHIGGNLLIYCIIICDNKLE